MYLIELNDGIGLQVEALAGQRVVQVSCGSRDAQTLALVEGKKIQDQD